LLRCAPGLAWWATLVEEHRQRAADLAEFEERMAKDPPTWNERNWQAISGGRLLF
jgi:hypothetical protein